MYILLHSSLHAKMITNMEEAKKKLDYRFDTVTLDNIKHAFHASVRRGHADKGGSADIQDLIQARDFMVVNLSWLAPTCAVTTCSEAPRHDSKYCAFHACYV